MAMVNVIQTGAKEAAVITVDSREDLVVHVEVEVDNSVVINEALVIVVVIRTVASNNIKFKHF